MTDKTEDLCISVGPKNTVLLTTNKKSVLAEGKAASTNCGKGHVVCHTCFDKKKKLDI